ncbi:MAG: hypothetical protein ABEJ88_07005 [Halobacterium sp.]
MPYRSQHLSVSVPEARRLVADRVDGVALSEDSGVVYVRTNTGVTVATLSPHDDGALLRYRTTLTSRLPAHARRRANAVRAALAHYS